jgi:hypothetical protein
MPVDFFNSLLAPRCHEPAARIVLRGPFGNVSPSTDVNPRMKLRTFVLLAALPLTSGCSGIVATDFDQRLLPAFIEMGPSDPPLVEVPQSVRVGERFTVQVTTYGDGCTSKGSTQVNVTGREVQVSPYDFYRITEGGACTRELRLHVHQASVWIEEPGTATVSVQGRRLPDDQTVTVTRTLTVTAG